MTDDLTCQELVELVTDYLDGGLPGDERARFEAHIAHCVGCTKYLEQFRETIRVTGALREDDVPPAARTALLHHFAAWKRQRA